MSFDRGLALYEILSKDNPEKYTGSMVKAFRELNISQGYYSKLYRTLVELGCIEVVVNGRGGGQPSVIKLYRPPTLDEWASAYQTSKPLTNSKVLDTIRQRLEIVERRLGDTDIGSTLVNHHQRLEYLEETLSQLIREVQSLGKET